MLCESDVLIPSTIDVGAEIDNILDKMFKTNLVTKPNNYLVAVQ